jgi:hypothetical protein
VSPGIQRSDEEEWWADQWSNSSTDSQSS